MRYVLARIDECDTASDVFQFVNILIAITWVAKAWEMVKSETISKCFRKAGVLANEMNVVTRGLSEDKKPFLPSDEYLQLQSFIGKTMTVHESCTMPSASNFWVTRPF